MPNLLTISLNNVRFRAYHGVYPEERQKGNDFVVNMHVSYLPKSGTIVSLDDTIDYGALFTIMNSIMQQPVDLLETLVQGIAQAVHQNFPQMKEVVVSVEKLNPPIDKFSGSAAVWNPSPIFDFQSSGTQLRVDRVASSAYVKPRRVQPAGKSALEENGENSTTFRRNYRATFSFGV